MDIAQATNTPEHIRLAGDVYPVRVLRFEEWGALQAWIKANSPSPLKQAMDAIEDALAAGTPYSAAAEQTLLDHAQAMTLQWPPRIGSDRWFETLDRVDGATVQMIWQVLSKTVHDFTVAKAKDLYERMTVHELRALISFGYFGLSPEPSAPKEPAPSAAGAA